METKKKFGLIGKNISYSFSKKYFEEKFKKLLLPDCSYDLIDLNSVEEFPELVYAGGYTGLNVTIPYKTAIIPFLDELSDEAEKIGAVNCILIKNGKKKGFNTDAFGFEKTLNIHRKADQHSALILGNGGAAKAVQYVLSKSGIPYKTVSRKGNLTFENLSSDEVSKHQIIIQTTPVGTFPNENACLSFPFEALSSTHLIIDLIYNPPYTAFMKKAAAQNAKTANGYYMLEQQAEKAWEIWNFQEN